MKMIVNKSMLRALFILQLIESYEEKEEGRNKWTRKQGIRSKKDNNLGIMQILCKNCK